MLLASGSSIIRSTTVLLVKRDGKIAMAGDGQVTLGETVIKANARKVRRISNGKILAGFAGSTADAILTGHFFQSRPKTGANYCKLLLAGFKLFDEDGH